MEMENMKLVMPKISGEYLFIASLTPFLVGLVSTIVNVILALRLGYSFLELAPRFIFGVIMIALSITMMLIAQRLQKHSEK